MTDNEFLNFAAKAGGIELHERPFFLEEAGLTQVQGGGIRCWNPLKSDGDALRLAVKLGLYVSPSCANEPSVFVQEWHGLGASAREDAGTDPYAATRRAIVRAAALIGKSMT